MKVYQFPGGDGLLSLSPPCVRVQLALRRLGVEYEVVNLLSSSDVRRVSSTGRVPTLEIDGDCVADSVAIMDRLESLFPESDLFEGGNGSNSQVTDRLWEHFANDHIYWLGFYMRWCAPEFRSSVDQAIFGRLPFYARLPARKLFVPRLRKRAVGQGIAAKTTKQALADLDRALAIVEGGLGGGPYLSGRTAPGRGDLGVASIVIQAGFRNSTPELQALVTGHPPVIAHAKRVLSDCSTDLPRWLKAAG